jgi:hypothetical protein
MAVFMSVTTSPFEDVFEEASRESRTRQNVRRPLRGIEVKRDTYATIKVIDALNRPIQLLDSSSSFDANGIGYSTEYSNFILQAVQEQRVEKQQVVETFGEDYIFFFGERPRIYTFSAILMNTRNFNWKSEWWKNYEETLRGTKLLERNARMYLYYDDVVIEGYMLQANATATVDDPYKLPLQFQVFCTNYSIIGNVGSIFTPLHDELDERMPAKDPASSMVALPDGDSVAAGALADAASQDSLGGFLAEAAKFFNDATFTVQKALENAQNTLYGRSLAFPNQGLGNQLYVPDIQNKATSLRAPGADGNRVPIWQQRDEYTAYTGSKADVAYDEAELSRVGELLKLRSPEELNRVAREKLQSLGVNVDRPSAEYLLLGRGAFAGIQAMGSFGIRQVDGELSMAGAAAELPQGAVDLLGL